MVVGPASDLTGYALGMRKLLIGLAVMTVGGFAVAQTKQPVTPAVRTLLDKRIGQYTKARCVMSYSYQTLSDPKIKPKAIFEELYKEVIASFERTKALGQSYDSSRGTNSFWILSSSSLAGESFTYSDYNSKAVSIYTCKAKF